MGINDRPSFWRYRLAETQIEKQHRDPGTEWRRGFSGMVRTAALIRPQEL